MNNYSPSGANLLIFRRELRLTQAEFGRRFGGYTAAQIGRYERGASAIPTDLLQKISAAGYETRVNEIMRVEPSGSSQSESDTEQIISAIEDLLETGDEEMVNHIRRQISYLRDAMESRRRRRRK